MEMVRRGLKTCAAASVEIGVSYRQAERIYKRYRSGGDDVLVHGDMGRPSNHKTDKRIIGRALELYRRTYPGYGENGGRDGLDIGVGALRRALIQDGQGESSKNKVQYQSHRASGKRFGELELIRE
jgi:hypothetical protein